MVRVSLSRLEGGSARAQKITRMFAKQVHIVIARATGKLLSSRRRPISSSSTHVRAAAVSSLELARAAPRPAPRGIE
eukprot:2163443-Pyramimonas_sp.AAC.1